MPGYLFSVGLGASICQTYLSWRVYRFTQQWFWIPVLAVPILGSVIGAFLTGQGAITATLETRASLVTYVTIWLSFKAGADVLIGASPSPPPLVGVASRLTWLAFSLPSPSQPQYPSGSSSRSKPSLRSVLADGRSALLDSRLTLPLERLAATGYGQHHLEADNPVG